MKHKEETYRETKCKVRVGNRETEEFWTRKGVKQGCPMSPTLFNIYIADIGTELAKGVGGVRLGKRRLWSMEYADDVVLLSEGEEAMKKMMRRLERYLKKKKLGLSLEKSQMMVFRKEGKKRKAIKWKWKNAQIEGVNKVKYLGYILKSNNEDRDQVKDRIKKAQVAMRAICGIGERKFKGDILWRMALYDAVVGGGRFYLMGQKCGAGKNGREILKIDIRCG